MSAHFKVVAITGASAPLGTAVVQGFIARGGFELRLLQRKGAAAKDSAKLEEFVKHGAKVIEVDYKNIDEVVAALQGVQLVVNTVNGAGLLEVQLPLIEAAKKVGVKRFVPSEFGLRPDVAKPEESIAFAIKTKVAHALEASGLEYTYFSTNFFLEGIYAPFFGFDFSKDVATVRWPGDGTNQQSGIIGTEAAARVPDVLIDHWEESRNKVIELTTATWTFNQLIEEYKKVTGKDIKVEYIPIEQAKEEIKKDNLGWGTFGLQLAVVAEQGKAKQRDSVIPKWFPNTHFTTLHEVIANKFKTA